MHTADSQCRYSVEMRTEPGRPDVADPGACALAVRTQTRSLFPLLFLALVGCGASVASLSTRARTHAALHPTHRADVVDTGPQFKG